MPKYIEELVSQQVRRSEIAHQRRVEEGKHCAVPIITISRRMGSGARIVAAKLAHDLGWSLWDRELIDAIAQDANVSRRVVERFDEHTISEIDMFARSALGDHEMGGFIYARHLARAVTAIAKLGSAIFLGRGANFILPHALNVRIDASDDRRVDNMMNYENLNKEQAEAKLRQSDKDREHFLEQIFGHQRVQSVHYDLTIWMDEFTTDDAVEIIKAALKAKCRIPTGAGK
ncbi:MAG: cytidylate kinase-like family protein [Armatimonadota bacterium]|nr:cytidylate kinase-like family protein [bacterium]